jgi:hypothetical protein
MTTEHPITPPPELVHQWVQAIESNDCIGAYLTDFEQRICTTAARWGADQELEACCEWLASETPETYISALRAARRPKPPSLKEQALQAWCRFQDTAHKTADEMMGDMITIRRALEQLGN